MRGRLALVALAIAACGDGAELPDAGMGSDGPARGLVTVRVLGTAGQSPVYFQTASGAIALATRTNQGGVANALMPAGGFVSVVEGGTIYTWTGVQPGDELVLDLSVEKFSDIFPDATVRIDPMEGAFNYYLFTRCESFREVSPAIEEPFAPFFQPCGSTTDLLLVAWGNTGPIGYRYRANVALLNQAAPIDLRGTYSPMQSAVDLTAPNDRSISVRQKLTNLEYLSENAAFITDHHAVLPMAMPVIPGTTVHTVARTTDGLTFPKDVGSGTTQLATIVWGPASQTTTVDMTTPALREITSEPELDRSASVLRWTESESGGAGDVVWANLRFGVWSWIVIGAHAGETSLRLPVLPQDELGIDREAMSLVNFAIIAVDGGYDRLRPYLLGHWSPSSGKLWPMQEASGRVSYRSVH